MSFATGTPITDNNPLPVTGNRAIVAANFTRPADTNAYAVGDLVANNVAAGSVVPLALAASRMPDGTGVIRRGRLTKSGTVTANAIFRAHLYKDPPTPTNGDNGAFQTGGALTYVGSLDFDMTSTNARAFTDGVKCIGTPNVGSEIIFDPKAGTQNIYALIEARGAYVPVSGETFTLALEVFRD
ncbi:hypothetical protein [Bradyrhizobium sp. Gha]|uniref:hypothetical protein n=1 Tax=Bradyrhizobium sp. Gha TaxID=1855318 RepID=UPI0008EB93B3|nr:hypothetical protein [Bradyrhizobium sp. Gha]SFK04493.1 hypothetical protein SAMN05216525_14965 [Bradyrhizobium sp. Gha]